jgi:hypothetical protein
VGPKKQPEITTFQQRVVSWIVFAPPRDGYLNSAAYLCLASLLFINWLFE